MALDFTVIVNVRQRFGNNEPEELGLETEAPFVGQQKDFPFQCPHVDRGQSAVLLFQSQGVTVAQNMEINGHHIFGGIPTSVDVDNITVPPFNQNVPHLLRLLFAQWNGNVMLVHPGVLQENNVLRVSTRDAGDDRGLDDFVIDNVVVFFKTRSAGVLDPGGVFEPR